jgi:hypothetical protein
MANIEAIKKKHLESATKALMPLLDSRDPVNWPVLHIPMHANTFPLAYIYSSLLLSRVGKACKSNTPTWIDTVVSATSSWIDHPFKYSQAIKDHILEEKILDKDWGNDPPKLDRDALFNLFFANKEQIDDPNWKYLGSFYAFHIFNYSHQFFLGDGSPGSDTELDEWIKCVEDNTEIRIITDIKAQAGLLHSHVLKALLKSSKNFEKISIALSSSRKPTDVLHWTFVDKKQPTLKRIFLFGTPLCEILKSKYQVIPYTTTSEAKDIPTYLCIVSSNPSHGSLPASPIYEFFKSLKYNEKYKNLTSDGSFEDIATAFRQCVETNLPDIPGTFIDDFNRSISVHCKLASRDKFFSI